MHTCFITPSRAVISVRMVVVLIKLNIALFYSKGAECKSWVPLSTASITLNRKEFVTELRIKLDIIRHSHFNLLYFWIFERLNAFPHLQSRDESVKDLVGGFSFTKTFRCREEKNRKDRDWYVWERWGVEDDMHSNFEEKQALSFYDDD